MHVLGIVWDTENDTLGFNLGMNRVPKNLIDTKREFLKVIMSVYDAFGLISLFILKSEILMQENWRSGVGRDEPMSDEEFVGW